MISVDFLWTRTRTVEASFRSADGVGPAKYARDPLRLRSGQALTRVNCAGFRAGASRGDSQFFPAALTGYGV
jgi:hypothetical protein